MGKAVPEVERELDGRVAALGYELVQAEWAGSAKRPLLRLRIDRPASAGSGVTLDDCSTVSRALEGWLDGLEAMPERYVLEVSSPGVDRPLVRDGDYDRFHGEWVAVKGRAPLAGRARRLEGELLGLDRGTGTVRLRLEDGTEVAVPRAEISGAHLVFRWE